LSVVNSHFGDPLFVRVGLSLRPTSRAIELAEPLRGCLRRPHMRKGSEGTMQTFTTSTSGRRAVRLSKLKQIDVLLHLVENGPGRTETELAQAIFGHKGYRQQVNPDCVRLARSGGEVERRGSGGHADPHRYYPIQQPV
jgi:hypothetical protein